jgi:hypothetical protein
MRNVPAALRAFLEPYDPAIARLFFAIRKAVLRAAPDATELIYDAYNAVTVAYSFTDRLKEAFCHVAAYQSYVNLGFNRGAALADPERLLVGSGTNIRHIRIAAIESLQQRGVQSLLQAAVEHGRRLTPGDRGAAHFIVKATYPKKRRPPWKQRS